MGSPKKYRSMKEIMRVAKRVAETTEHGGDDDECLACEQCGAGDRAEELLLCDKCDRGFHMLCLRPIITRVPIGPWCCPSCSGDNRLIKSNKFSHTDRVLGLEDKSTEPNPDVVGQQENEATGQATQPNHLEIAVEGKDITVRSSSHQGPLHTRRQRKVPLKLKDYIVG